MAGMLRGSVDRAWAQRHHAKWVADVDRSGLPVDTAQRPVRQVADATAKSGRDIASHEEQ
jgi:hypothetical protein